MNSEHFWNALVIFITAAGFVMAVAYADTITRPTKDAGGTAFQSGNIPTASDFNADFNAIANVVNGNIDNANIKASAGISSSKLADIPASKIGSGTLATARIPNLNANKINAGTLGIARIPGPTVSTLDNTNASIAWALGLHQMYKLTLNGNKTMAAPTGATEGGIYVLRLRQDATGGRTVSWNSAYKFPDGDEPDLSDDAGDDDILTFVYLDSEMRMVSIVGGF